ncbi:T9SS type A sorting domain-containing protein [Sphingobacteriales bacterium CHB3]|nr:T9SS type A sorting domain-containing protein [Sphingobacteriales bacterium CHB3]
MRYPLAFLLLVTLAVGSSAQQFEWANVHPLVLTANYNTVRNVLTLDTADNPVSGRLVRTVSGNFGESVIEKLNTSGTTIFSDTLFGKVFLQHLTSDNNNNLIAAGLFRDTIRVDTAMRTLPSSNLVHSFIMKLDPDGRLIWLRNMTQANPIYKEIFSLKTDGDNNIWAATSPGFPTSYVMKLDGNGNEVASFQQINARIISSLAIDAEGNVWAAGSTFDGSHSFNGLQVTAPYPYNIYVVRYSPSGAAPFVRFVQDITLPSPFLAATGRDVIMGGRLLAPTSFGGLPAHGPRWVYDLYSTRIDSSGSFAWLTEVPFEVGGDAGPGEGPFLATGPDGSVIATGFTRGTLNWGNGVVTQAQSTTDILVISHSFSDGTVQWAKTAGGVYYNRGDAVAIDRRGAIYVAGMVGVNARFDSLQFTGEEINTFIARIGPGGATSVGDKPQPYEFALHQNYPNPFNPMTTITFSIPVGMGQAPSILKVYDLLGREVATLVNGQRNPGTHKVIWNAEGAASGVYICRLTTGGLTAARKLLLLR